MPELIIFTILVAFAFDFVNGRNDAANSIATSISTRVLSPKLAVGWAAAFNFSAIFFFDQSRVAQSVGTGIINPNIIDAKLLLCALIASIIWAYYFCGRQGIPVSSSHSLAGGLIGAAFVKGLFDKISGETDIFLDQLTITFLFILLAPLIGFITGYILYVISIWSTKLTNAKRADTFFRIGQLLSSAAFSIGHGANDAQKTMGVIAVLLYSYRHLPFVKENLYAFDDFQIPFWVEFLSFAVIALGTLFGGRQIIKTMGVKLTNLTPVTGFSAETAGALTLFGTAYWGIPVSTTQTISGSIVGAGASSRVSAVRWGIASNILVVWIITIPVTATISGLFYLIARLIS